MNVKIQVVSDYDYDFNEKVNELFIEMNIKIETCETLINYIIKNSAPALFKHVLQTIMSDPKTNNKDKAFLQKFITLIDDYFKDYYSNTETILSINKDQLISELKSAIVDASLTLISILKSCCNTTVDSVSIHHVSLPDSYPMKDNNKKNHFRKRFYPSKKRDNNLSPKHVRNGKY